MIRASVRLLLSSTGPRTHYIFNRTRSVHVLSAWTGFRSERHSYRFMSKKVDVPSMGDSITEGTISQWVVKEGDSVNADDVVCVIETDKVSIDVRAPVSGKVTKHLAESDSVVGVGAPLFEIEEGEGAPAKPAEPSAEPPKKKEPAAAAAAAATEKPAKREPEKKSSKSVAADKEKPTTSAMKVAGGEGTEKRIPMTRMRVRIAERLKEAQNTAASLTTFNEIDMSALMSLRKKHKDLFQEVHGAKLGFMSAFVKASVKALREQPAVNAYIEGKEIVYHDYVDISVAVATPTGLVVPVLRNCHTMSFADVEHAIVALGKKARDGQLALEDMAGGTFTISNGGVYGSLFGTPILNPPQSAILGMHGIFDRPIAVNGEIKIRPLMYIALTYDHRIIDGREAVTFLKSVKESIEDPSRLLLEFSYMIPKTSFSKETDSF